MRRTTSGMTAGGSATVASSSARPIGSTSESAFWFGMSLFVVLVAIITYHLASNWGK